MNVFISADIEGVTGVVTWGQSGGPNSEHYDWDFARRMMTHDVNAAIRGARAAGAKQVVVRDAHGSSKNLLIDQLEPGVELVSGRGATKQGMMIGLDETFDAAFLVGYHAMAGTAASIMEHTINGVTHRVWVNDIPVGEQALSTALAGVVGVPVTLVTSDRAGCAEARELIPGVQTYETKIGLGRYLGRLKHPSETGPGIEEAAKRAVEKRQEVKPWVPESPIKVKIEQNRSEEADAAAKLEGWKRLDAYTLEYVADTWMEAHTAAWTLFGVAGSAASANTS
ncbi:MAG: M55 family metallopeptidase [Fimbriimonadaceae bacterium]